MKTRTIKVMLMATALFSVALIAACSDDDNGPGPAENREELAATITEATLLAETSEEGTIEDQFQVGSIAQLEAAIASATEIFMDATSTQNEVNAANENLKSAVEVFMSKKVAPIAAADLIARWKFDEGFGTVAMDDSPNGFDGEFKTGPVDWGAGVPTWTEDRHGNAGKAIHFDEGANIEIPYNTALNPTAALSISAWVKTDVVKAGNRFIGLHSWVGYKFELQDLNHSFVSIGHEDGTYDKDGQVVIPNDEWHHLVATFGGGKTILYLDGETIEAATYNDTPNPAKSISGKPYNLVLGQDFPTDKYSAGDGTNFGTVGHADYQVIPLAWGGYFQGDLDEVRIYKSALTGAQVLSIYNNEKPD